MQGGAGKIIVTIDFFSGSLPQKNVIIPHKGTIKKMAKPDNEKETRLWRRWEKPLQCYLTLAMDTRNEYSTFAAQPNTATITVEQIDTKW